MFQIDHQLFKTGERTTASLGVHSYEIGSSMKGFNPVGIGHSTNNRQSVICSSVISNAPVSCLPQF